MVSEKKRINEIVDDEDDDDDADGRRIIPIALGLSAGGLKMHSVIGHFPTCKVSAMLCESLSRYNQNVKFRENRNQYT